MVRNSRRVLCDKLSVLSCYEIQSVRQVYRTAETRAASHVACHIDGDCVRLAWRDGEIRHRHSDVVAPCEDSYCKHCQHTEQAFAILFVLYKSFHHYSNFVFGIQNVFERGSQRNAVSPPAAPSHYVIISRESSSRVLQRHERCSHPSSESVLRHR